MFENEIDYAVFEGSKGISNLPHGILDLPGYSSSHVRHFLNNLLSCFSLPTYLEIGVHKGSTFVSALYGNLARAFAIDNWSEFATPGTKEQFMSAVRTFVPRDSVVGIFEEDCFKIDLAKLGEKKINIYFYDGNHYYDSQKKAFTYFDPILADNFIAIVDDYNWDYVRKGTEDAFKELEYEVVYKRELLTNKEGDPNDFWNGLGVFEIQKKVNNEGKYYQPLLPTI